MGTNEMNIMNEKSRVFLGSVNDSDVATAAIVGNSLSSSG